MNTGYLLTAIKREYSTLLTKNLVGIYLHGSIVLGSYNDRTSDLDYIIVVRKPLDIVEKLNLMQITMANLWPISPKNKLEFHVVLQSEISDISGPIHYDFHFSKLHLPEYLANPEEYILKMNGIDRDLLAHVKVINQSGVALFGDDPENVFGKISDYLYLEGVYTDICDSIDVWKNNPRYYILNLCRTLAYLKSGTVLSKERGGFRVLNHQYAVQNNSFNMKLFHVIDEDGSLDNGLTNDVTYEDLVKDLVDKIRLESPKYRMEF